MEFRVLQYFLAVVREESITRAAEVLHITQPTLSRQLAQLEEELGVNLFSREKRKIALTNEGVLLRRRAEEIIELIDKTERELLEEEALIDGVVSFGCGELASVQVLSDFIKSFHQKYPRVRYDLYTANADQIKDRMDRGLTDIGLLLEPVNIEKYDYIRLNVKERWVVLMPPDDELAKKDYVTAEDLKNLPMIITRRTSLRNELASWFGDYFKSLNIVFSHSMSTNAAIMVRNGLGYALVIEGAIPFWDKSKICYKPLYPEITATTVLAWKRQQPFSLATTEFIRHVKCLLGINK
ncbi:LysR family transcriptional regulator [Sporomusa aerivorans]|uniref:LysR family transcriptional regulator n=1 Tax=Sporomusa aerivorans TaxID=204936 RepID=UPI00352A7CE7